MLAHEIVTLARHLVTDTIPHDYISILLACRLVPLKTKDNGIRPVGLGVGDAYDESLAKQSQKW